jgi:hypothetical protein
MMIRHKVADFDQWKPVYEDHRSARQAGGLEDLHLWRNQDDPGDVVIVFTVLDAAKAKEFIVSPTSRSRCKPPAWWDHRTS